MASIVWDRDPQEAMNNPYEYNAQKQFDREANSLIKKLSDKILANKEFSLEEYTLEKAVWMLQTDAIFAFKDAVLLLEQRNHRTAGRLLRDIIECIHLVEYLCSGSEKANRELIKWFDDTLVMHSEYRDLVKGRDGVAEFEKQREIYKNLSKFTHRSYKVLLYGYALGRDNRIFYDAGWSLPQSVSMCYAIVGYFGTLLINNLKTYGVLDKNEVEAIWNDSMEAEQMPRGYLSKEDKDFFEIMNDSTP